MGNTVSDLAFPDNPKRRKRAEGLRQDIIGFVQKFERAKKQKEEVFQRAREELDSILKQLGVSGPDELEKYIRDHMKNSADLKAYDELKKSIDKHDKDLNFIVDISGLASSGAVVLGGVAVVLGILTFSSAMALAGVVGALAAIVGLVAIGLSILDGAVQRAKLRDAIPLMIHKRAEAMQYMKRMDILNTWAETIISSLDGGIHSETLMTVLQAGLKKPWTECTLQYCYETLQGIDRENGAWMEEDGSFSYYDSKGDSEPGGVPHVDLKFTPEATGPPQSVSLNLLAAFSSTVCLASSGQDRWFIHGKEVADASELKNQRYDLELFPSGTGKHHIYRNCLLEVDNISVQ